MSLKSTDNVQEIAKGPLHSDAIDSIRHTIYDTDGMDFFKAHGNVQKDDLTLKSLPNLDLTGFDKEAPDHSSGLEKLWHGIEHMFGKHRETVGDQVREKVVDEMKNSKDPAEQAKYKQYEEEEKAIQKYQEAVREQGLQMTLVPGKLPEPPDCPMHDEVAARARKEEAHIIQDVRSRMTPAERKQVDDDEKTYEQGVIDAHTIHNPMGTGEGYRPPPAPSDALAKYWRHIQEAADLQTGQ